MCTYPWYEKIEGNSLLEQGVIIEACKILHPDEGNYKALLDEEDSEEEQTMGYIEDDFIIMSQSCDLANDKIESVIMCPLISLNKVAQIDQNLNLKSS